MCQLFDYPASGLQIMWENTFVYYWSHCELRFLFYVVQSISTNTSNTSRWHIIPLLCIEKLRLKDTKGYMWQLEPSNLKSEFLITSLQSFQACFPPEAYTMIHWISGLENETHQNCHQSLLTHLATPLSKYCIRCILLISTVFRVPGFQNYFAELHFSLS